MARLPQPRAGTVYKINRTREIPFSFWPTKNKGKGRRPTQERLYSNDPWGIVRTSITSSSNLTTTSDANYFIDQARDFFEATRISRSEAGKPVLLYYCALNLVKALLITKNPAQTLDVAKHGLHESNPRTLPAIQHTVIAHQSNGNNINVFDEIFKYFAHGTPVSNGPINIKDLMRQVIVGHRLFVDIERISERFIHLKKIEYVNADTGDSLWLRLYFDLEDIRKAKLTIKDILVSTGLDGKFRQVAFDSPDMICLEQTQTYPHAKWPSDALAAASGSIKNDLWTIMLTSTPYTRHYVFVRQAGERVFPQLLSIYALFYYFSSVTRYRPSQFQEMISSKHGGFVSEFINNQMTQFIYLIASEFASREVAKPSVL